jgi:hypothetical protein
VSVLTRKVDEFKKFITCPGIIPVVVLKNSVVVLVETLETILALA